MVRTARAAVGGVCYHILNRGNDRKTIFHEAADFEQFLSIVGEARTRYPIELFAYCLMPNHFHFVVRPRVAKAEDWRWGSLSERQFGNRRGLLDGSPCALPRDWDRQVNAAEPEAGLHAIRSCVGTGRPFGSDAWVSQTESTLGAQLTPRPRGRPRKPECASTPGALLEKSLFE